MADIFVMRPRDALLCACGVEVPVGEQTPHHSSSTPATCGSCRDAETTRRALATRRALTDLVAHERGYALHRRTVPGTDTTIDHLFVGPSAVFVIHDQLAPDTSVGVARSGGRWSAETPTLTIGGEPRPELSDAVHAQCLEVAEGLAEAGHADVPVVPVICFVDAHLPRWAKHRRVGDVRLTSDLHLADEVGAEGPFDGDRRFAVAMSLVSLLPSRA